MISSTNKNSELLKDVTHHDKFYSRLLSKESSLANPSFRVYYGGASGAVPFVWESRPGTPKRTATADPLPPLTPPPSYHFNHPKNNNKKKKASSSSNLIQCILHRTKKSPSSASVSLSSTTSTSSSGSSGSHCTSSSFSSRAEDEDSEHGGSPTSAPRGGCYSMKNVLLSIVGGGGSGHGS